MKRKWLAVLFLLSLVACTDNVIQDNTTKEILTEIAPENGAIIIHPLSVAMDRGQHDLAKNVVVDTSADCKRMKYSAR